MQMLYSRSEGFGLKVYDRVTMVSKPDTMLVTGPSTLQTEVRLCYSECD